MGSVWKRLQRYNKRAAKFKFTLSYSELDLVCSPSANWLPSKIAILLTRRSRRVVTSAQPWEPSLSKPYEGRVNWSGENQEVLVTLFHDSKSQYYEGKDWNLVIEEVSNPAKVRHLGTFNLDMSEFVAGTTTQRDLKVVYKNLSKKIQSATLKLQLTSVFLKEGKATDEDMQSVASLMSAAPLDINPAMDDMDDDDAAEVASQSEAATLEECGSQIFDETTGDQSSLTREAAALLALEDRLMREVEGDCGSLGGISDDRRLFPGDVPKPQQQPDAPAVIPTTVIERGGKLLEGSKKSSLEKLNVEAADRANKPVSARSRIQPTTGSDPIPSGTEDAAGDLLAWSKTVTGGYDRVTVTNFTTSWRNGLAFCAVISKFRPDLINFDELRPDDIRGNCKRAFDASDSLGIPRIIEPSDMVFLNIPDKLAVMTYLYQLKTYFESTEKPCTPAQLADCDEADARGSKEETQSSQDNSSPTETTVKCMQPDTPAAEEQPAPGKGVDEPCTEAEVTLILSPSADTCEPGEKNVRVRAVEAEPVETAAAAEVREDPQTLVERTSAELAAGPPPVHIHRRFPDGPVRAKDPHQEPRLGQKPEEVSPSPPSSTPTPTPSPAEPVVKETDNPTPAAPEKPATPRISRRMSPDVPDVVQRPPRRRAESNPRRTKRVSFSHDVPPNPANLADTKKTSSGPIITTSDLAKDQLILVKPEDDKKPDEVKVGVEASMSSPQAGEEIAAETVEETPSVDPSLVKDTVPDEEVTKQVEIVPDEATPAAQEDPKETPPAEQETQPPSKNTSDDVPDVIKTTVTPDQKPDPPKIQPENFVQLPPKTIPSRFAEIPRKSPSVGHPTLNNHHPIPVPPRRRRTSQTSLPHSASTSGINQPRASPTFPRCSTSPMPLMKSKSTGFQAVRDLKDGSPLSASKRSLPTATIDFEQPLVISIPIATVPRGVEDKPANERQSNSPAAVRAKVSPKSSSPAVSVAVPGPCKPPPIAKPVRSSLMNRKLLAEGRRPEAQQSDQTKRDGEEGISVSVILPQDSAVCLPISSPDTDISVDEISFEVKKEPIYATVDVSHKKKPAEAISDPLLNAPDSNEEDRAKIAQLEKELGEKEVRMEELAREIRDLKLRIADVKEQSAMKMSGRSSRSPGGNEQEQGQCSFCHKFFGFVMKNYEKNRLHADNQFMSSLAKMYDAYSKEFSSEPIECRLHADLIRQIKSGLGGQLLDLRPPVKIPRTNSSAAKLRAQRMIELSRAVTSQSQPDSQNSDGRLLAGDKFPSSYPAQLQQQRTKSMYIQHELESLESEQGQIDQQASRLEKKIREVMGSSSSKAEEERLLMKWFSLVNKKSALLRRQMQLHILEKEDNLERRLDLLTGELREILDIEDSRKTDVQREREQLLLNELVDLVNKRDELVRHMHYEEQEMDEENEIAIDVMKDLNKPVEESKACVIQ